MKGVADSEKKDERKSS